MTDERPNYNGWTNWETWNVNLWLSNDEPMYRHVNALAMHASAGPLAERIESYVRDMADEIGGHFGDIHDLHDLDTVDWTEIATAWLAE